MSQQTALWGTWINRAARRAAILLVAGLAALPAQATEQADFDVYVLGIRAGTLSYAISEEAGRYALAGKVRTSRAVGTLFDLRVDVKTQGRTANGRYRPELYVESSRENENIYERAIRYGKGGTPQLTSDEKPRKYWVPVARQAGALDPLTTVYELLRDRDGESPCGFNATFSDGARMGQISSTADTGKRDRRSRAVTCSGVYERKGGFSKKELKQGTHFPFQLTYQRRGETWALTQVNIRSTRGRAKLVRR